ncbi:uncharacterized protein LOC143004100 isoform X2 [Genypterus blacodes]|uniref:uncharacterized protein LOC143004100 isoform X2 n=1 Tax=Genypterus blacodes TaxID=154954 RepID=UPI003F764796
MIEFRWMETLLFVMSALLLTAAAQQQSVSSFIVRKGDAVTLPCKNVISDQVKCRLTTWAFNHFINSATVELIHNGVSRSDRGRLTADCFLAIKRVTEKDVGRYYCQQYESRYKVGLDSEVYVSLVNTTKHTDDDRVTLTCSLLTYGRLHTLKWLYDGTHLDRNTRDIQISSPCYSSYPCSITANFMTSKEKYKEQLKCEVRDVYTPAVRVFSFTHQSSDKKSATPITTTTSASSPGSVGWLPYVSGGAGLGALFLTLVLICSWKPNKRHKLPKDDIDLSPAVSNPGANQIMFLRNPHGEDDAVTYAAVNISSSPAAALSDPTNPYSSASKKNTQKRREK